MNMVGFIPIGRKCQHYFGKRGEKILVPSQMATTAYGYCKDRMHRFAARLYMLYILIAPKAEDMLVLPLPV